jgi:hypothetical protein
MFLSTYFDTHGPWWSSIWEKRSDLTLKFALLVDLASPLCWPKFKSSCALALKLAKQVLPEKSAWCQDCLAGRRGRQNGRVSIAPCGSLTTLDLRNPLELKGNVNWGALWCHGGPGWEDTCCLDSAGAHAPSPIRPEFPLRPRGVGHSTGAQAHLCADPGNPVRSPQDP